MLPTRHLVLCLIFAFCLPAGQLLFKLAVTAAERSTGSSVLIKLLTNGPLYAAFALYAATALLWYYILTQVPLSRAYIFSILGSAMVPAFAWLFFNEEISARFFLGCAIMLIGLYLAVTG